MSGQKRDASGSESLSAPPGPTDRELDAVMPHIRQIASRLMRGERGAHTLQTTALINEAYLRLRRDRGTQWLADAAFYSAAAEAMRRVLVDHARERMALKRGGAGRTPSMGEPGSSTATSRVSLDVQQLATSDDPSMVLDVEAAIQGLAEVDAGSAEIVRLRVYCGMTVEEVAAVTGRSPRTAARDWAFARAWLYERLRGVVDGEVDPKGREPA